MKSQTASQIEAARKNIREALSILPDMQPEGMNDIAWGEMVASFEYLTEALKRLDECKYQDALKQPKRVSIPGRSSWNPSRPYHRNAPEDGSEWGQNE